MTGWLLRLVALYLTERKMTVRYRGASSSVHSLPGGCAQGNVIGMQLPLLQLSDLCMDPVKYVATQAGDTLTVPAPAPAMIDTELRLKWIDDVSYAEAIRLEKVLEKSEDKFIGPREYHERRKWVLKKSAAKIQET